MPDEEQRLFTLTEAERTRVELEPLLLEAMEERRLMGELRFNYDEAATQRLERNRHEKSVESALERISATGCVVKDLNVGLLDFPARLNDEDIYFCWRVGEDRIRFYHRQDEGFAGRRPIDPRDADYRNPIQ